MIEALDCFETGVVKNLLLNTPELRVLKLQFPVDNVMPNRGMGTHLRNVVGEIT